jgi:hypothetical protein
MDFRSMPVASTSSLPPTIFLKTLFLLPHHTALAQCLVLGCGPWGFAISIDAYLLRAGQAVDGGWGFWCLRGHFRFGRKGSEQRASLCGALKLASLGVLFLPWPARSWRTDAPPPFRTRLYEGVNAVCQRFLLRGLPKPSCVNEGRRRWEAPLL